MDECMDRKFGWLLDGWTEGRME